MTQRDFNTVKNSIRLFLEEKFPDPSHSLQDDTDLMQDWLVDSMGVVEIVVFLEKNFGIAVRQKDLNHKNFHSIHTLTAYVLKDQGN